MFQGSFQRCFKVVSKVLKGSFMGVSIVFVFIEVIASTRAYGWLVSTGLENCPENCLGPPVFLRVHKTANVRSFVDSRNEVQTTY